MGPHTENAEDHSSSGEVLMVVRGVPKSCRWPRVEFLVPGGGQTLEEDGKSSVSVESQYSVSSVRDRPR